MGRMQFSQGCRGSRWNTRRDPCKTVSVRVPAKSFQQLLLEHFIMQPLSTTQPEDYNWKFPNRDNTMYLSTLQQRSKRPKTSYHHTTNDVTDIDGAQSRFVNKRPPQKQSYINRNDDIEGSTTKPAKVLNVEDRRLNNDDIVGTRAIKKFKCTRTTNPLDPFYKLPVVEYLPYETPNFIRDSINADDIEGTKTKPTKEIRNYIKQEIKERLKPYIQGQNTLNVKDINLYRMKHVSTRQTNPLEPTYNVIDENNKVRQIGAIDKSKPKVTSVPNVPDFMNNVKDIQGTTPVRFFNKNLRYHQAELPKYKETNYVNDIAGTQVASKKKGIVSVRATNPLFPKYQYPGHSERMEGGIVQRPRTAAQKFDKFIT